MFPTRTVWVFCGSSGSSSSTKRHVGRIEKLNCTIFYVEAKWSAGVSACEWMLPFQLKIHVKTEFGHVYYVDWMFIVWRSAGPNKEFCFFYFSFSVLQHFQGTRRSGSVCLDWQVWFSQEMLGSVHYPTVPNLNHPSTVPLTACFDFWEASPLAETCSMTFYLLRWRPASNTFDSWTENSYQWNGSRLKTAICLWETFLLSIKFCLLLLPVLIPRSPCTARWVYWDQSLLKHRLEFWEAKNVLSLCACGEDIWQHWWEKPRKWEGANSRGSWFESTFEQKRVVKQYNWNHLKPFEICIYLELNVLFHDIHTFLLYTLTVPLGFMSSPCQSSLFIISKTAAFLFIWHFTDDSNYNFLFKSLFSCASSFVARSSFSLLFYVMW